MNQFDFKEFRIIRCPHRGKYGNLTMTIELQEIDAPLDLELYYRKCWQEGTSLTGEVKEIEKEPRKGITDFTAGVNTASLKNLFQKEGVLIENKSPSIYQEFKWFCERVGKDYEKEKHEIFKKYILFPLASDTYKHMKDLEKYFSFKNIEDILKNRMQEINEELGFYNEQTS